MVACRKQYMFGRAMGQWRKGTRELPGLNRQWDRGGKEEEQERSGAEEKSEEEKEVNDKDEKDEHHLLSAVAEIQQFAHATRARTRGATPRTKQMKEEQSVVESEASDESQDDIDMSDDDSTTPSKSSRNQPWSNVQEDELPPGKLRSEYRRCRHTCGCKGRTSGDKRAVVNKHGRRNHEKSESQHANCDRRYTCYRLFGSLKQNGEGQAEADEDHESEEDESEWSEEEQEEDERGERRQPAYAVNVVQGVAMEDDSARPVFGPPFPLPAAPSLYRPSSVLAHSGATSASSTHPPSLYTSSTAPTGIRMAVVQSLLDLGPSATQQRQVSAARATEWMRWKDDNERYEETIRTLRTQLATMTDSQQEWQRKEEGWSREREEMKARIEELEAKVRQLKRSATDKKKERKNSRGGAEFAFAAPVAPQSPKLMATYPAIPMSTSSPRPVGETAPLYHSPSSAFAAVGRGQLAATTSQLPAAHPFGSYWPPPPLSSTQLFPQAPYPLAGLWSQPFPAPQTPFRNSGQQQQQQQTMHSSPAAMTVSGFPSPMSTLSLAAQPVQRIIQTSAQTQQSPFTTSFAATTPANTTTAAMPAITLSPAAVGHADDSQQAGLPVRDRVQMEVHTTEKKRSKLVE